MGYLGDFLETTWYEPSGIAYIISLYSVENNYRVQNDRNRDNAFYFTKPHGVTMQFEPTTKGLNTHQLCPGKSKCALVITVQKKMQKHSKEAYQNAVGAQQVQNIMNAVLLSFHLSWTII